MKRFLFLLTSLLSLSVGLAQEPAPDDERADDRAALRALGAQYEQAINSGDLRPLAPSVTPAASAVFATNHEVHGLDAMQQYFDATKEQLGRGSTYTVKLKPDRTEFFGDLALARGTSDEVARLGSGREYRFTTHWTALLRKDAGGWKAHRLHVSMDPLDNPAIAARLQWRTGITAAIGVLAAITAFLLGRRSGRRTVNG